MDHGKVTWDPLPPKKEQMSVGVWRATSSVFWDMAQVPPPPRSEHRSGLPPPEVNMEVDPPEVNTKVDPPEVNMEVDPQK